MSPPPTSDRVSRFDWEEMRRYWERHQELRGKADLEADPHALANVCSFGVPQWLNDHYAAGQEIVFDRLLARVPRSGGRALDVGCGGARWSERLSRLGWEVTGIDLQEPLIESNRRRLPHIRFERVAVQDFEPGHPFSLVCSVTVLGHIPHSVQHRALERLRVITEPGSRVLVLENVRDQASHVFANSVAEWTTLFGAAGFTRDAVVHYDFNPCMRALAAARQLAGRLGRSQGGGERVGPDSYMTAAGAEGGRLPAAARRAYWELMRMAGRADRRIDPWLTDRGVAFPPAVHAGMLFVRA